MAYIYKILNRVNGKYYIGSTKNLKQRWYQHKSQLNNRNHANKYLQNAWNKYGEENFEFIVLEECTNDKQFDLEQQYLDILKPFGEHGYNISVDTINFNKTELKTRECEYCGKVFETHYNNQIYCSSECCEEVNGWIDKCDWIMNKKIQNSTYEYSEDVDPDDLEVEDWIHAWIVEALEK